MEIGAVERIVERLRSEIREQAMAQWIAACPQQCPEAPRIARQGVRSISLLTRPLSPPSGQLIPSASTKAIASLRPPSR